MNCKALINDFLLDYHAGTLSRPRRLEFDFHLTLCAQCRRYVDSYKKTVSLAKSTATTEEEVPPELVAAILKITRSSEPGD